MGILMVLEIQDSYIEDYQVVTGEMYIEIQKEQ